MTIERGFTIAANKKILIVNYPLTHLPKYHHIKLIPYITIYIKSFREGIKSIVLKESEKQMTDFYSGKTQRLIECTSISLGVVLGAIYLDPMTLNTYKNEMQSPLANITNYTQARSYQFTSVDKDVAPRILQISDEEIIVASR